MWRRKVALAVAMGCMAGGFVAQGVDVPGRGDAAVSCRARGHAEIHLFNLTGTPDGNVYANFRCAPPDNNCIAAAASHSSSRAESYWRYATKSSQAVAARSKPTSL